MAGYQRLSELLQAIRDNWYQPACRFVLIIVACARNLFHPLDVLPSQLFSLALFNWTIPVELQLKSASARLDYTKSNRPTFHAFPNSTLHQLPIPLLRILRFKIYTPVYFYLNPLLKLLHFQKYPFAFKSSIKYFACLWPWINRTL